MGHNPSLDSQKLGMRSPRSPNSSDLDWQKLHNQFFDHENKQNMDSDLGNKCYYYYYF